MPRAAVAPRKPAEEVPAKLVDILSTQLFVGEDEVTFDSRLREDLGADSLDVVEVAMDLEQAFDIAIDEADEELLDTATVRQVVDLLKRKGVAFA